MTTNTITRLAGCVMIALIISIIHLSSFEAQADPFGTGYLVTTENAPNSGAGDTKFDGAGFETIPGTGIDIDEHALLTDRGELIEFWVRTTNGENFVVQQDNRDAPSTIWIQRLRWIDDRENEIPGVIVPDSAFIYFTADGEPLPMGDPLGLGFQFGTSPTNPNIQTLLLENGPAPAQEVHLSTELLGDGATFLDVFEALELNPRIVNDFHFGFFVRHVPEPGTLALGVLGFLGVVTLSRRRRAHR